MPKHKKKHKRSSKRGYSRSRTKRGFSGLVIVAIIAAVLLAGGGYFFLTRNGNSPVSSLINQAKPRVSESQFMEIKDANVRKNIVAQINQDKFRTKESTASLKGFTETETQLIGDNFNFKSTQNDGTKEISSEINIGDTVYIKDYSDGKWWKQTQITPTGDQISNQPEPTQTVDNNKQIEKEKQDTYKFTAKEPCPNIQSLTCFKYQENDPSGQFTGRTFWFDDSAYLLRKETNEMQGFNATIEYSYDNISVQAPSPTKDVPQGKSIYDYLNPVATQQGTSGSGVSQQDLQNMQNLQQQFQQQNTQSVPTNQSSSQGTDNSNPDVSQ